MKDFDLLFYLAEEGECIKIIIVRPRIMKSITMIMILSRLVHIETVLVL